MGILLETTYPGRTKQDANDPDGNFLNSSPPGSFTGTPADQAWARDVWAFLEKIRILSGITMSGSPDSAVNSQRYETLLKIARDLWPLWDSTHTYGKGFMVVASDDSVYQSLQASNLNHDPISSPTWWKKFQPVDVIDDLITSDPVKALSANQGVVLKGLIDTPISATITTPGISLLPKRIIIANGGATQIFFNSGVMKFDDGSGRAATPSYSKNLAVLWSPGNAGGLDTGSIAPNTLYFCYAIYNPTTSIADYIMTATWGSPTLPAGYTKKEYLGTIKYGATNILLFDQFGKKFLWDVPINDIGIPSGSVTTGSRSLYAATVPMGFKVRGIFEISIAGTIPTPTISAAVFTDPDQTDVPCVFVSPPTGASQFSLTIIHTSSHNGNASGQFKITTNSAAQIGIRGTTIWLQVDVMTKGWEDLFLED